MEIVGGAAVPEQKQGTNIKGESVMVPTGSYTVNVRDPSDNSTQPVTLFPGNPMADGTPTWIPSSTPDTMPKQPSAAANTFEAADGSRWEKVNGQWTRIQGTEGLLKPVTALDTLKAQADQADIDRRKANELAGRGYLTDNEWITFQQSGARLGMDAERIRQEADKFAQSKKIEDAKLQPQIDQIKAQTTLAGAQAGSLASTAEIAGRKAGPEIEEIGARTDLAKAQALNQRQQALAAGAPTIQANVGTGQYIYQQNPLTGDLTTTINQNFQPKTQADVASRMAQLQGIATKKRDELQAKMASDRNYTAEQANSDWANWWGSNVENQKAALQAAQEDVQFQRAKDEAAMRTSAYTAANAAGNQAITAASDQAKRRVGAGFGQAANALMGGGSLAGVDFGSALTWKAPDLQQQAHNATMEALKYISPGAAQATGTPLPNYQGIDIAGGLNQSNYAPFGTPIPGAAPAPVAPAPPAPGPYTGLPPSLPAGPGNAAPNQVPGQNYGYDYNTAQLNGPRWANPQPLPPDVYGYSTYSYGGA